MRKVILAMIAGASAWTAQAASAQEQAGARPAQVPPTTIVYPDKGPSGMSDLPMGVHRIPDSNVIVTGHQKGSALGLFGVFGMLAQSAVNADAGKGAVRNVEDDLRFDVAAKAADMTRAMLAGEKYGQRFTLSPQAGGVTLSVVPYVLINFEGENQVRPYVVLKTTLSSGSPRMVKYFCCEGKPLPLSGDNGLSANNGEGLKALLTAELETALNVMLLDRSQPYARDNQAKISIEGYLPFLGKPFKLKGYDLGRYNDDILFEIRGGSTFGGVHVAEPSALEIKPAKAK